MVRPGAQKIDSLRFYASIAGFYDDMAQISPAFPPAKLINSLMTAHFGPDTDKILDVGIGTGLSSQPFAEQGYKLTGVDGSREMLQLCGKKNIAVELVEADFTRSALPFAQGEFDAAFSANTLYLLPEPVQERVIGELHRVTKPGGVFAFNYEPRKPGELGVRFNDATTDKRNPCGVETYSMEPGRVRRLLSQHQADIVEADTRVVAHKLGGLPITFETVICRNP